MIRKAVLTDLNRIFEIYSSHCIDRKRINDYQYQHELQKHGFLLGLDTKESIRKLIDTAYLFLVDECENKIRGYIIFNREADFKDDNYKVWLDSAIKKRYYRGLNNISIYEIAIGRQYKNEGVASELLKQSEIILKRGGIKEIFSIVTTAPLTNCPSLLFHHKNGFRRIAIGKPRSLFNLENYSSILFAKII